MARNLDREQSSDEMKIDTKSSISKDGRAFYTRLVLPTPKNKTLEAYFRSPMHQQQIELLIAWLQSRPARGF